MDRSDTAIVGGRRNVPALLRGLLAVAAAGLAVWLLAGCSNPWKEGKPDPRLGENCYRASTSGPMTRVTNYVDPELCGRVVAHRSQYHVRTLPTYERIEQELTEDGR